MRVLFAAKHPPAGGVAFGGVASWIKTLQKELTERGHECATWGPAKPAPQKRVDVGILANTESTGVAAGFCDQVLQISHGVVAAERPHLDAKTAFTSEEVRAFWDGRGEIIPQPIDLDFWRPDERPRDTLLFYSYRAPSSLGLEAAAEGMGLKFVWARDESAESARELMRSAAVVCASGRAALEAMACGAKTLVCDWRPYNAGPLVCQDFDTARRNNYSGRGGVDVASVDMLALLMETQARDDDPRAYVRRFHDARTVADLIMSQVAC